MNSESHQKLLMKILNEAHVTHDITLDKFGGIINNITTNNHITFIDDELPTEGRRHNKALHISVMCLDHIISRVLIDNGSSLNVISKSTLAKLPCNGTYMRPSPMVVRAFDGSHKEVMGEIDLPVQIGPVTFEIMFHMMDIVPAYSCLLGRPWIHSAGVVLSTLHQNLKYMVNDQLVIVSGEGYLLISGGLGYKPTRDDKRRLVKKKKEKRLARIENREPRIERILICDIRQSFQSARPTSEIHIAATKDDMFDGEANWIRPCGVGAEIRNWKDMPGLGTSIVEHKLPLKPDFSRVKQKLRRMKPDMSLKIREEVKKQFDAGFLTVANYPQWIANTVPVPKKDGKVRMCVDYRDVNIANP
ncbi:uncharacterized protein [Cicer arietinum]|uniref:uncharacterized protein n=1 Tax=Cicer arietinum TaxID=3827 RepID=UPI003CC6A9E9